MNTSKVQAFLEKNNALEAFKTNFHSGFGRPLSEDEPNITSNGIFSQAFIWMNTPQGEDFWKDLAQKWRWER